MYIHDRGYDASDILHPENICSCTKANVGILCPKFATDLNDSNGLFCDTELVRDPPLKMTQKLSKRLQNL